MFVALLAVASDFALGRDRRFLAWCAASDAPVAQPLRIEATLRALRPGEAGIVVIGNSIVDSHVDAVALAAAEGVDVRPLALYGASMAEVAMLGPQLARTRPRLVLVLASLWTLFDHVAWDEVRVYDPGVAYSLAGLHGLLSFRQAHASHLLGSLHFVIRHRQALRLRLAETLGHGDLPVAPSGPPMLAGLRADARRADFRCTGVNARGLEALAGRLGEAGVPAVIVAAPSDTPWDRDEEVGRRFDECLAGIGRRTHASIVGRDMLPAFGAGDFMNADHLTAAGRRRFTEAVGRLLPRAAPLAAADRHALQ